MIRLMLIAMLLGSAVPALADGPIRELSRATFEARGIVRLEVENPRGDVEIVPGRAGEVRLEALKLVHGSEERARRLADETVVEAGPEGDRLVVRVRYPRRQSYQFSLWEIFGGIEIPNVEVRLTLTIPPSLLVDANSTSGELRTRGLTADQSLKSTSGDVEVEDARGLVRASSTSGEIQIAGAARAVLRTTSGDISVAGCTGPLRASTVSGTLLVSDAGDSVTVESVSGDLTLRRAPRGFRATTTSGELVARDVSGHVRASSGSGDIEIRFVPPLGGVDASTASGNLDVWLPEGARCAVDMKTSSGEILVQVPLELETATRHRVTGRVGGGEIPVLLRSSSGDIGVMSGGS
jgi:Putative adhesin